MKGVLTETLRGSNGGDIISVESMLFGPSISEDVATVLCNEGVTQLSFDMENERWEKGEGGWSAILGFHKKLSTRDLSITT